MKDLFNRRKLLVWGLLLLMAWTSVGLLLFRFHGHITADDVAGLEPERPWLAALILLGLFLLKSVDFLLHIGVLFAACGRLFSLPFALLLSFAGKDRDIADPWYTGNFDQTLILWKAALRS